MVEIFTHAPEVEPSWVCGALNPTFGARGRGVSKSRLSTYHVLSSLGHDEIWSHPTEQWAVHSDRAAPFHHDVPCLAPPSLAYRHQRQGSLPPPLARRNGRASRTWLAPLRSLRHVNHCAAALHRLITPLGLSGSLNCSTSLAGVQTPSVPHLCLDPCCRPGNALDVSHRERTRRAGRRREGRQDLPQAQEIPPELQAG